jgi:uncharacterized protein
MQIPSCENKGKTFFIILLIVIGGFFLTKKFGFSWGTLQLSSPDTISVTGFADGSQLNQKASFRATVTIENIDKDVAAKELTSKTNELIDQIKDFGIESKDIKTQNLSIYEFEDIVYEGDEEINYQESEVMMMYPDRGPRKTIKKWRATNSLVVTVEDVDKAADLSDLLLNSEATNVSGPSFEAGDTAELEKELLEKAMKNAEEKADTILKNSKQRVVKIIQVSEGSGGYYPMYQKSIMPMTGGGMMDAMESIQLEPGSQEMSKTVTVTFEIR